jgi:thymidylate kinase
MDVQQSFHRFVVIEGIDGAGKSSLLEVLRRTSDIRVVESPLEPFLSIKNRVLEEVPPPARLAFFMAANLQVSSCIDELKESEVLVCSRYIWSTIAYHAAINRVEVPTLVAMVKTFLPWIRMPRLVIYLGVERRVQIERLKGRTENGLQAKLNLQGDFQERLLNCYSEIRKLIKVPWKEIDTSEITVEQVTEQALALIKH